MAHAHILNDDRSRTGFDWADRPFGALAIDRVFSETPGLHKERLLETELYRISLFRRDMEGVPRNEPVIESLALDEPLEPAVARQIVWGGASILRAEALEREETTRIPILMYHRVAEDCLPALKRYCVHPRDFEDQLRFLRQHGYYALSPSSLLKAILARRPLPGRPVMLTFDDGYKDFRENAWPLLEKHDFGADVFVVTDKVGGRADWDAEYGPPAGLMDWGEIADLFAKGCRFGSHLATHPAADGLPTDELIFEGASSRLSLEARLGAEIRTIAFPYGAHDDRVVHALRWCGYELGFTTADAVSTIYMDPMRLPRVEITGSDDLRSFAKRIRATAERDR
jgi:peptidoglycan/xylan/chitin deacetylase (PgdA/CDA1 family)